MSSVNTNERTTLTLSSKHHFVEFSGLEEKLKLTLEDKNAKAALRNGFTDPPAELFLVRGPNYLKDGHGAKNVVELKVQSKESPYELIGVNMFRTNKRMKHIAAEVGPVRRFVESHPADSPDTLLPEFMFINWLISPLFGWGKSHVVQHAFRLRKGAREGIDSALERALSRFKGGSEEEKNSQLKYVFRVVDAPSAVKTAVSYMGGERPVLIGKALTTKYNSGKNYLEVNMDVSSSKIASAINGTILKNVESLVMDCSWLLEGQKDEELPERVLCKIRWVWNCVEDVVVLLDDDGEPVN